MFGKVGEQLFEGNRGMLKIVGAGIIWTARMRCFWRRSFYRLFVWRFLFAASSVPASRRYQGPTATY
ncbi:MAG: hypothetical protein DMG30_15010 [Acidobacteria bacterium]|nr:MAG: hypothetical protein DMG30_15010 [Acidobacteriota bacterium]